MQVTVEIPDEIYAAMESGLGRRQISERFNISEMTCRMWVKAFIEGKRIENSNQVLEGVNHEVLRAFCKEKGINISEVSSYWTKSKEMSVYTKLDKTNAIDYLDAFEKIIRKYPVDDPILFEPIKISDPMACVAVTSDEHVGLDPLPIDSIFAYEYNAQVYGESMQKVFGSIEKEHRQYGTFDLLLLDDLGDTQDGWNGLTTRGNHSLEQNMTELEMFECCVDNKVKLVRSCVDARIANKIMLRTVTNANHSHQFALIVNSAVQKIINMLYDSSIVEIDTIKRFVEHRVYGNHCFVLTHGKDAKFQNRGLPFKLTDAAKNFIWDYIEHYGIDSKFVHVHKGDLHQVGYERTKRFDYRNFMSFAPPSAWVQHNFGDSYSGYSIQIVPKWTNEIAHTDYFLDYKKKE